ncbi:MAG: enoyl-CoA hydratase [Pseudomonadota bacterium]
MEHVAKRRVGAVGVVSIVRPEALNALSLSVEASVRSALLAFEGDDDVRAIVLTGEGRAFSAGVDLKELGASPAALRDRVWHGPGSLAQAMREAETPIIGAVNGFAVTGGLELALHCDFLIASETAAFADTHARVGITPSWGMTQLLPRLVGPNRARQMSLTGAYVDASTALEWGLVNEVVPPAELMPRALAIAAEIAETDRPSMEKVRRLIDDGLGRPLAEALEMETAVFDEHIASVSHEMIAERRRRVQAKGRETAGDGS